MCSMGLPPLCRYFRGGVILFFGVLLKPRGTDLGSLLGVCLSSWGGRLLIGGPCAFWGPGVLIWGPFWVSVWGLGVEACRQQLKYKKIAPVSSALPILPKRLPPSVLAVRCDLRVLRIQNRKTNTQITRYSEHTRGKPFGHNGQSARLGCDV